MEYAACHRAPPFFSEKFLSSQIQAILYQLSLAMQKKRLWPKRENRTALRVLQYIDNNKGRQLQNQDYAAAFGMTYRRLNAIFQAVYGVTIKPNACSALATPLQKPAPPAGLRIIFTS